MASKQLENEDLGSDAIRDDVCKVGSVQLLEAVPKRLGTA